MRLLWAHRYLATLMLILGFTLFAGDDGGGGGGGTTDKKKSCGDWVESLVCGPFVGFPGTAPEGLSALQFEPNLGQFDTDQPASIYQYAASSGSRFLLSPSGPMIQTGTSTLRAVYEGARSNALARPLNPLPGRTHYLRGNDPHRWVTDVPTYGRIEYQDVYPGVNVVYYGAGRLLEHDFVVAPGADPTQIRIRFEGADKLSVNAEGAIVLSHGSDSVLWKKPALYQMQGNRRVTVEGRYRVEATNAVAFEIGVYDKRQPLVIDPVVVAFSTYYGRGQSETATRAVVDANGNIYYTGGTADSIYPTTGGALTTTGVTGDADVIITKLSADGRTPVYTTHLGGASFDVGSGIALDASGNIYVTGLTNSQNFPVTKQIQTPAPNTLATDKQSCFITKLNAAGNALVYSTLLGGTAFDVCTGIAVDASGSAWVSGATSSPDFPTKNAFQSTFRSSISYRNDSYLDGFVAKLSPDGASLLSSSFLGGTKNDVTLAIALDSAGNAYVTGGSASPDFPTTTGVLQTTYGGGGSPLGSDFFFGDAYVTKITSAGALAFSTYLGGSQDELGIGIALDAQSNIYVTGSTLSTNFPVRAAAQATFGGSGGEQRITGGDGFLVRLNPQGTALVYSTYLGGSLDDRGVGVTVDSAGNASVTGNTLSNNFPVTTDALQAANRGQKSTSDVIAPAQSGDAFFAQYGPDGKQIYSSYLGGQGADLGIGIALDGRGGVVITGSTNSTDFPTTSGVAQSIYGGQQDFAPAGDAFITRFSGVSTAGPALSITSVENAASYSTAAVAPGEIVIVKGIGIGPTTLTTAQLDAGGGIAKVVSDTRILFDDIPSPLVYVWNNQSSAVVPYGVSGRASTSVVVEYKGVRTPAVVVPVTAVVPGLFTADSSGRGQGAVLNENGSFNSLANPAEKGSVVQLFGTGEGLTRPAGVDGRVNGAPAPVPVGSVSVTIGGRNARVVYAGGTPGVVAGLLQVNAVVPDDAPSGNAAVQVQVGAATSQTGFTIAVR